jgi:hypothetical protein
MAFGFTASATREQVLRCNGDEGQAASMACPSCAGTRIQSHPDFFAADKQDKDARPCVAPTAPSPMPFLGAYAGGAGIVYLAMDDVQAQSWSTALIGVGIIAVGLFLMMAWITDARAHVKERQRWRNTWFCHGCGQSHLRD